MRHLILTFLATAATLGGIIAALTALHLWSWAKGQRLKVKGEREIAL